MGFFTYRQAKKTREAVTSLQAQEAATAAVDRNLALFQQLPAEGKAEYRALEEECRPKWSDGMIQGNRKRNRLANGRAEIFRRYDLIP